MKYTESIEINAPIEIIWEGLVKEENLKKIHPTITAIETIDGTFGTAGSKSKMIYEMNDQEMVMTEEILEVRENEFHKAHYSSGPVNNTNELSIRKIDENKYDVSMTSEFNFSGIMRFMALFMKGSFKKETRRALEALKELAENA